MKSVASIHDTSKIVMVVRTQEKPQSEEVAVTNIC